MSREKSEKHFIQQPVYRGGREAMKDFIRKNLKYPKEAVQNRVEGTVTVKYTIDYKGNVIDTHIVSGLGYGCDEEASRLVKLLKFDVPPNRKVRVKFQKDIHIHFRLPARQPAQSRSYSIRYTQGAPSNPADTPKKKGYSYTITIKGE